MKIKHLLHTEINLQQWDTCLQNATNSLVYAESWYLDIVSPNWEALVSEDYEYVMPLPVKRKFGIPFVVQPPLTQQLGIFSSHRIDENMVELFIQKTPYKSYHLNFNEQNPCNKGVKKSNSILNLSRDYETIFFAYSQNTKRNIKKTQQNNIEIKTNVPINDFLEFYYSIEKNYRELPKTKVILLLQASLINDKATIYGAYNEDNELVSALCLLYSNQRLIYLLPVSNKEGKESLAMFKLVDEIIRKYANSNLILDFEGSNVKNIARFYESFGAEHNYYYEIKCWSINDFIKHLYFWK